MIEKARLKHKILSILLAVVMVVGMLPVSPMTVFAESQQPTPYDGIPVTPTVITSSNYQQFGLTESNWSSYNGYYGIRDAKELYGFAELVNDGNNTIKGVLLQDIVINETVSESGATYSWTPIGNSSNEFIGTFDGNGHTVSGLYINSSGAYVGMFGVHGKYADYTGTTIKNLTIADSYICGKSEVGGITGAMSGTVAVISNCKIAQNVTVRATSSGDAYLGGICGYFALSNSYYNACSVTNCVVLGKVDAPNSTDYVGAIVGFYRAVSNAYEFIVVSDCYYIAENTTDADGIYDFGKGGGLVSSNEGCTKLTSVSNSHTCISVTHKEVQPTCRYPGLSEYSFCLICEAVTSGTKAVTAANSNAHVYYGANCCVAGVCGVCNTTGSKNMENHESTEYIYRSSGTQHYQYHACCNTLVGTEDHTYNSVGMCLYCEYVCPHDQYDSKDRCVTCGYLLSTVPTKVTTSNYASLGLDASYVGYYAISNEYELYWFAGLVNGTIEGVDQDTDANAVLLRDITVNEDIFDSDGNLVSNTDALIEWIPIGFNVSDSTTRTGYDFSGIFDGRNHTVSGLYHNSTENWYVGLFGYSTGTIHSVTVADSYLKGNQRIGGIAGWNEGSIYNCASVECQIIGTNTSDTDIGGVVGISSGGHIENCYSSSSVSGSKNVGGICGWIQNDVTVKNCYNTGSVTGTNNVGGVVGCIYSNENIENCYFDSVVFTGSGVGYIRAGTVTDVEGKTTEQFKSGEVTWLLNGETATGDWKQTLEHDDYPNFTGKTVYAVAESCIAEITGYSNDIAAAITHIYDDDGICTVCGAYEPAVDVGGEGALFRISNAGQLLWYAQQYNSGAIDGDAELTADIAFPAGVALIPIGTDTRAYGGTFNGNGKTVNFGEQTTTVGYFGIVGNLSGGTVKDLTVSGAITVNANVNYVSGVVGAAAGSSTIEGCTSYVDITLSENAAGSQKISGIAGQITTGTMISHCANYGDISANGAQECIGGITGYANENCLITDCANYGEVSSDTATYVSGILGYINNANFKGVQDCLNVGTISGSSYVGDIIGWARNYATDTIVNNYYNGTTGFGADAQSGKNATATKVTDDQLKSGEIAWLLNNSTSEGVWKQTIGTDDYPNFTGLTVLYDETADPQYYNESLEIISVNISWGAMEFTYTDGEWQPASHTYSDGAWTPDEEGGNEITVQNNGNVAVNVTFAYDKTVSEVEGSFTDESGNAVTSSVALAVDEEKKFKLLLSGKPNDSLDNATLGSITVTIALPSEEEGS